MERNFPRSTAGVLLLLWWGVVSVIAQSSSSVSVADHREIPALSNVASGQSVAGGTSLGIWISPAELAGLKLSGPGWRNLKAAADEPAGTPDLSNQDDPTNVRVLAKALVHARTGQQKYRREVISACMAAIGTERGGRSLALGRELAAYVIAADLVGLPELEDERFRSWLRDALSETLDGKTLRSTHELRPNNWGTHAGASRLAAAVYLNDREEVERGARVFKGWLGDRASYAGFEFGDLSWQADPAKPVGINPKGATRNGHSIDGVLPDDQRRGGSFKWPAPKENYVYEALQGALVQAVILYRQGYEVWNWQDRALLRAFQWLHTQAEFAATGDDTWEPYIVNYYYRTKFPAPANTSPGKNMGWTEWTHGAARGELTGVTERNDNAPSGFDLEQNYPNPFIQGGPATHISFHISEPSQVDLTLYNMLGQEVRKLFSGQVAAGRHTLIWEGTSATGQLLPSGVYHYKLTAGATTLVRRLTVSR